MFSRILEVLNQSALIFKKSLLSWVYAAKINGIFFLNRITRKKNILFLIDYTGSIQYVIPVIQEILERDGHIDIFIVYGDKKVIRKLAYLQLPENHFFPNSFVKKIRFCDAFVSPTQWTDCPRDGFSICMFHGQPSKNITFLPELIQRFNGLFFIGPFQRVFFEVTFTPGWCQEHMIRTFDIGYPKSDNLYKNVYKKDEILHLLTLPQNRTTVLYAPSYEEGTSLREFGEEVIQELVQLDVNVLVKLHPASLSPEGDPSGTQNIDWVARLKKFECFENYRFLQTDIIDPYLVASDIMVTDVSSVAFEFMTLDRPIIYFDSPEFFERYLPGRFNFDPKSLKDNLFCNAGRQAGLIISTPEDLKSAISRSIANPSEFSIRRKEISEKLVYNPGHAAAAAADMVRKVIEGKI